MMECKGEEKKLVELEGEVYKFIGKEVYITVDGVQYNIRDLLQLERKKDYYIELKNSGEKS